MRSATVAIGENPLRYLSRRNRDEPELKLCPYWVISGMLDKNSPLIIKFFGGFLHVCAWLVGFSLDIATVTKIKPDGGTEIDRKVYDVWWLVFVPFAFGFAVVALNLGFHFLEIYRGRKGADSSKHDLTPTAVTLLKYSVLVSSVGMFLILQEDFTRLDSANSGNLMVDLRACCMTSLACKLFIFATLGVNQKQALKDVLLA